MHILGMTRSVVALAFAAVVAVPMSSSVSAIQGTNDDWCRGERSSRDRSSFCEVREFTVAATSGTLAVEGDNGGISVEGEARSNVRIVAKVVATASSDSRAREIAAGVQINPNLEHVEANGPRGLQYREGWSVSYRLAVPRTLNLSLRTGNGGISVRDIDSKLDFRTTNGGVKLIAVNGDVRGQTTNGGMDIDLEGPSWNGEGLDVETSNGGVRLSIPDNYSARLEARTNNGGLHIDYPGSLQGRTGRDVTLQLGSGGAPIKVRTSNGGVRVTRK